ALGGGKRLFPDGKLSSFKLVESKPYPSGVVGMHYVRAEPFSSPRECAILDRMLRRIVIALVLTTWFFPPPARAETPAAEQRQGPPPPRAAGAAPERHPAATRCAAE